MSGMVLQLKRFMKCIDTIRYYCYYSYYCYRYSNHFHQHDDHTRYTMRSYQVQPTQRGKIRSSVHSWPKNRLQSGKSSPSPAPGSQRQDSSPNYFSVWKWCPLIRHRCGRICRSRGRTQDRSGPEGPIAT